MSLDWNHIILHLIDGQHVLVYHVTFSEFLLTVCYSFTQYQSFQNAQTLGQFFDPLHIYQGLDVAVFGVMKACWMEEVIQCEQVWHQKVCKENFL